jgi:ATP-dependent helicase Lhr and Lhr-like helicase
MLRRSGLPDVEIRTWVRTGDTSSAERERMRRRPPHILVTTLESLYLTGIAVWSKDAGRTRSVIVEDVTADDTVINLKRC